MADIPTQEPESFVAGDTVKWNKSLDDYKASDGWTLKYWLRGASVINITATASGADFSVVIPAATTAGYTAGTYEWISTVEKASERFTVGKGYMAIEANLATATTITNRLIALEADVNAINEFLGKNYDYSSYAIAGRSLNRYTITELFTLKDRLQAELNRLKAAERMRRGLKGKKNILVRINS